jgi:hypothetical protein
VRDDYQLAKHIMLLAIAAAAGPFIINGGMQFTKWLTSVSTTGGKRFLLAILAVGKLERRAWPHIAAGVIMMVSVIGIWPTV